MFKKDFNYRFLFQMIKRNQEENIETNIGSALKSINGMPKWLTNHRIESSRNISKPLLISISKLDIVYVFKKTTLYNIV